MNSGNFMGIWYMTEWWCYCVHSKWYDTVCVYSLYKAIALLLPPPSVLFRILQHYRNCVHSNKNEHREFNKMRKEMSDPIQHVTNLNIKLISFSICLKFESELYFFIALDLLSELVHPEFLCSFVHAMFCVCLVFHQKKHLFITFTILFCVRLISLV